MLALTHAASPFGEILTPYNTFKLGGEKSNQNKSFLLQAFKNQRESFQLLEYRSRQETINSQTGKDLGLLRTRFGLGLFKKGLQSLSIESKASSRQHW